VISDSAYDSYNCLFPSLVAGQRDLTVTRFLTSFEVKYFYGQYLYIYETIVNYLIIMLVEVTLLLT